MMNVERIPALVRQIFEATKELEALTGRKFTPDGHLVGSLGEVLAAHYYGLELMPPSTKNCDAIKDGKQIEIKATFGTRVALRDEPEHLLVLKLHRDGTFDEIYNGPGARVWAEFDGKLKPSNGQYQISLTRLKSLR